MIRTISRGIIHCSATLADPRIGTEEIDAWHKGFGWSEIGYHYVIRTDGQIEIGRDIKKVGAHARGYNTDSVGICLVGGVDRTEKSVNNFTAHQFNSLATLLRILRGIFGFNEIVGHRDLPGVNKDCPCFDVGSWIKEIGL